ESGTLESGAQLSLFPNGTPLTVKKISVWKKEKVIDLKSATAGMNVALEIDAPATNLERGMIISNNRPELVETELRATIFYFKDAPLSLSTPLVLQSNSQSSRCSILKVHRRIDTSSLEELE